MLTHTIKDPRCEACTRCKMQRKPCRRIKTAEDRKHPPPSEFGGLVTCDHIIVGTGDRDTGAEDTAALVIMDRYTGWIECHPAPQKTKAETKLAFQRFAGPRGKIDLLYSDGAPELEAAATELGWLHDTCTPDRKQTNGVAERVVRRVLEGARTALYQSGLE